jgi:hypothetical protein
MSAAERLRVGRTRFRISTRMPQDFGIQLIARALKARHD